ncbi:hypothetical protein F4556_005606 [Kitasatospora gansuensis]|uniref:Septum formation-related domain-containing protein n=1 Tax=Kitasatospora gansuensis TaxID=258050 RepID=A0A7W7WK73_9ACTN|nr:hypothetical protein [Kitasatospora gansuensis]MBB4950071.1 hypothetical protein [Kitasatospora gansuensis]
MRRRRVVATAVVLLLLAAGAVLLLWPEPERRAAPSPPPPGTTTPSPSPSPTPSKVLPYLFFPPGTCLDYQPLSRTAAPAEARPCEGKHDGEVIANIVLPDGLTGETAVQQAMTAACKPHLTEWDGKQGGGGPYFGRYLGPRLVHYQAGFRDATCIMSGTDQPDGRRLTGHLKGLGPS